MYPTSLPTQAKQIGIQESRFKDPLQVIETRIAKRLYRVQMALFRTNQDGEFENPFLISNKEGWVRKADVFDEVSPEQMPAELFFQVGDDGKFRNPFLNSNGAERRRQLQIEENGSPCASVVMQGKSQGQYDYFSGLDRDHVEQPHAESYFSDGSEVDEYEPGIHVVDEELVSLYSELSQPGSWIFGGDYDEFMSQPGAWVIGNDDEFTSPIKTHLLMIDILLELPAI